MTTVSKSYTEAGLIELAFQSPRVLSLAIGLPSLIGSLLRWRGSSVRLLAALVGLLGGETDSRRRVSAEIANAELAALLWPDALSPESAKNKITRWIRALHEDQHLSRAQLIQRTPGRRIEKQSGGVEFVVSRYACQDFDYLCNIVGVRLSELPVLNQRTVRASVGGALLDFGCTSILPEMRLAERQRQCDGKKRAQSARRIERAKRGEIEMDFQEIRGLAQPDRVEVLCGQFLRWGDLLLDEVSDYDDLEQLKWITSGMQKKFAAAVGITLERRYAAERSKIKNRSGLKSVA